MVGFLLHHSTCTWIVMPDAYVWPMCYCMHIKGWAVYVLSYLEMWNCMYTVSSQCFFLLLVGLCGVYENGYYSLFNFTNFAVVSQIYQFTFYPLSPSPLSLPPLPPPPHPLSQVVMWLLKLSLVLERQLHLLCPSSSSWTSIRRPVRPLSSHQQESLLSRYRRWGLCEIILLHHCTPSSQG